MTSHRPPTIPHPMLSQLTKVTKHSTPAFQIELPASATILLEMNFCQGLHLVEEAPEFAAIYSEAGACYSAPSITFTLLEHLDNFHAC